MKKHITQLLLTLTLAFSTGSALAESLTELPDGTYSGQAIVVLDRASNQSERYVVQLTLQEGTDPAGKLRVYTRTNNNEDAASAKQYYFSLTSCDNKTNTCKVSGLEVDGTVRIANVNTALNEITVTGAINTYEEGLYGHGQWIYDTLSTWIAGEGYPEVDFRSAPIRLEQIL